MYAQAGVEQGKRGKKKYKARWRRKVEDGYNKGRGRREKRRRSKQEGRKEEGGRGKE